MSKKLLRKKLILIRKKRYKKFENVEAKIFDIIKNLKFKINIIGGYYPINYEFDCLPVLKKFFEKKFLISLPVVSNSNQMNFFNWTSDTHLTVNNMGIPEPLSKKIVYPDLILVPLVGFDKNKFRLGYGGGYYDRYIEKVGKFKKFKTIGLSFSFQEIKKLPVNKFDKKLDFIITENKIYS